MQFFGGALQDVEAATDNSIRFNYNSFGKAGVTLLDLLTGNLWSEIMFDTVGATGSQTGIIFYVVWLVLSRWLAVAMVSYYWCASMHMKTKHPSLVAPKNYANANRQRSSVFLCAWRASDLTTGDERANLVFERCRLHPGRPNTFFTCR